MPTTLTFEECRRNAFFVFRKIAAYRGTLWEDDEEQVAMMAMLEAIKVCKPNHSKGVQAFYIQQYVRGRLGSFRRSMKVRHFEPEMGYDEEGNDALAEAQVEPEQETSLERREQCETLAAAIRKLPERLRKVVHIEMDPNLLTLETKGAAMGVSREGYRQWRMEALGKLRALIGEGI